MGCDCTSNTLVRGGVAFTVGSTSTENFLPLTGAMQNARYSQYRMMLELQDDTGDIQIKRAYQYSDDGVTWDAATGAGSWLTTTGFHYPGGFTSLSAAKMYFRIGVVAVNETGSAIDQMRVTATIDLTPR